MHCLLKLQLLITPIYCNSRLTVRFLLSLEMKIISYGNGNNKHLPPGCHWGNKMSDFGCWIKINQFCLRDTGRYKMAKIRCTIFSLDKSLSTGQIRKFNKACKEDEAYISSRFLFPKTYTRKNVDLWNSTKFFFENAFSKVDIFTGPISTPKIWTTRWYLDVKTDKKFENW